MYLEGGSHQFAVDPGGGQGGNLDTAAPAPAPQQFLGQGAEPVGDVGHIAGHR
ncbi:hypothetical protein [Streptomyces sp. KHY 26]|uniref:hypothetical protein n=1 Tax=Streptomyces sp. KHY 26 TaxID=3097359 RepID=UPI00376F339A